MPGDVEDVTGVAVAATVPVTQAVARAIDAGLFVARLHSLSDLAALRRYVTALCAPEALFGACSAVPTTVPPDVDDLNENQPETVVKIGTDSPLRSGADG